MSLFSIQLELTCTCPPSFSFMEHQGVPGTQEPRPPPGGSGSGSGCCSSTSPQRTPPPSLPPSSLLPLTSPTRGHTYIHSQPSSTPSSEVCPPPPALRGTGLRIQVSTRALGSLSQHPGSRASTLLLTPHPSPPLAPRRRQHLLEFFFI